MRYYRILITDPASGSVIRDYNTFPNGAQDPNGLDIEIDIPVVFYATPLSAASIRVWGIPLQDVTAAQHLTGKTIAFYGGMQAGLPLANPAQAGLLVTGMIQQAFGNWVGVDMTLDLVVLAGGMMVANSPANLAVTWKAGTLLGDVVAATLKQGFPGYTAKVSTNANLILNHDANGFYGTLIQFAAWVKAMSISIVNQPGYQGVDIALTTNGFIVSDGSSPLNPKQIAFNDMIGQAVWVDYATVQFTVVMTALISVDDVIMLPPGQFTTSAASQSQARSNSAIQGKFRVNSVRHLGRYRNPSGTAWCTIVTAATNANG